MRLCAFMSWPFWFVFHFSWHAFWNLFPFLIEIPLFVEFCVLCQSLVYILWISFHLMFQSSCLDEIHWDVHIYLLWSVGSLRFIYLFICLFIYLPVSWVLHIWCVPVSSGRLSWWLLNDLSHGNVIQQLLAGWLGLQLRLYLGLGEEP